MKSNTKLISTQTPSYHTYLKPGALAQLRYSKITARSKETDEKILLALCQLAQQHSDSEQLGSDQGLGIEGFPCFNLRVSAGGFTRCLQRKKLMAVTPYFSEAL